MTTAMAGISVVHVLYSFGIGGLEKGITNLINHGASDIDHTIISLCEKRDSERFLHKPARIICLKKRAGNSLPFILGLAKVIRGIGPDVVHTRNWSGMDGILAARLAGAGAVIHGEHGWDMLDPMGTSRKRRRIRRLISLMVSRYTCVSRQLQKWLQNEVGITKPVTQIYNGIDTLKFKPAEPEEKKAIKRELGLSPNDFTVGIISRLDTIKNHRTLFEAFKITAQKHPNAKLAVVGDGPEGRALQARAPDSIRFLGYRADVNRVLWGFDVFVLPSFNEGISNTILEAMASGLPVLASQVGGNPELIREGIDGALFAPKDVKALTQLLCRYVEDENMRLSQGRHARSRAQEKFGIEAMVTQYEKLWRSVAEPPALKSGAPR